MRKQEHDFDKMCREAFNKYEVKPPDYILDRIKTNIHQTGSGLPRKGMIRNHWIIISISSVLSMMVGGFLLFNFSSGETNQKPVKNLFAKNEPLSISKTVAQTPPCNMTTSAVIKTSESKPLSPIFRNSQNPPETPVNNTNNMVIYPDAGENAVVCGNEYRLNATLSSGNSKGYWEASSEQVQFVSSSNLNPLYDPHSVIRVSHYGKYTLRWTETNNQNPEMKGSDEVMVTFLEMPDIDAGENDQVCSNQYQLKGRTKNKGTWNKQSGIKYENIKNPATRVYYYGTGNVNFIWTEDNGNCQYRDSVTIFFAEKPDVEIKIAEPIPCYGSPVTLAITNKSYSQYKWNLDGGTISEQDNDKIKVFWKEGDIHTVSLTVWDDNGCSNTSDILVNEPPRINAGFYYSEPVEDMPIPVCFTNTTSINGNQYTVINTIEYTWNFGDGTSSSDINPCHLFEKDGEYTVKLFTRNAMGCKDSSIVQGLHFKTSAGKDYSNLFSPNGDGKNDIFPIANNHSWKNFKYRIIAPSGEKVYEWNNHDLGWDGKIDGNDMASEGVYFYIMEGIDKNNKLQQIKGFLYLLNK